MGRMWLACLALCALGLLFGVARGESGEYSGTITLLAHGPQGTHPVSLDTAEGTFAGSANLTVDLSGRVTGFLRTTGSSIGVSGKLKVTGTTPKLVLRSPKSLGVRFRGRLGQTEASGALTDKRGLLGGSGQLLIDLSDAPPLTAEVRLAVRNGTAWKRGGFAVVFGSDGTTQVPAYSTGTASLSRVHAAGGGFLFDGKGSVAGATFQFGRFKFSAYGVSVAGTSGQFSYEPNPPDVTLILASGHPLGFASDAAPYLADPGDAGPLIVDALVRSGHQVEWYAFVDNYYDTLNGYGYLSLVATLENVRDEYVAARAFPTKVVVVAHSHGGVRAHQAIEEVPDLPVRLLVDLDASSCDFNVGHLFEPAPDPVDAWVFGDDYYDAEDVVQANVDLALEVRSNEGCVLPMFEDYDEAYNIRIDGTRTGLFIHDAGTDHTEVHSPGPTMVVVISWMLQNL